MFFLEIRCLCFFTTVLTVNTYISTTLDTLSKYPCNRKKWHFEDYLFVNNSHNHFFHRARTHKGGITGAPAQGDTLAWHPYDPLPKPNIIQIMHVFQRSAKGANNSYCSGAANDLRKFQKILSCVMIYKLSGKNGIFLMYV